MYMYLICTYMRADAVFDFFPRRKCESAVFYRIQSEVDKELIKQRVSLVTIKYNVSYTKILIFLSQNCIWQLVNIEFSSNHHSDCVFIRTSLAYPIVYDLERLTSHPMSVTSKPSCVRCATRWYWCLYRRSSQVRNQTAF